MKDATESFDILALQVTGVLPNNLYMAEKVEIGHFQMVPFSDCPQTLLDIVRQGEQIGKGGFASVFELDTHTVCKITSCPVTQAMYAKQLADSTAIDGIPIVFSYLGAVGVDPRGDLIAKAYVVERCRAPSEQEAAEIQLLMNCIDDNTPAFLSAENRDPACHARAFSAAAEEFPTSADALNWLAQFVLENGTIAGDAKMDNFMVTQRGTVAFTDVLAENYYDPNWEATLAARKAEIGEYTA